MVVVVKVVEVVVIEVVVVEVVVVLAEAVAAAVVVVLLGGSEVPRGAEPEDDAEGAVSAEPEVGGAVSSEPAVSALDTGSACSVPGAAGAKVVVLSVVSGRATVSVGATLPTAAPVVAVSGLLSSPEEQAEPTSPKTAATATAKTHFVCLIPKKPLTADSGFIF